MKRLILSVAFVFAFFVAAYAGVQDTILAKKNGVFIIGAEKVDPMQNPVGTALGTGFLIEENRILTNAHVVNNSGTIIVKLDNSTESYEARIIRIDVSIDLALLEMKDWKKFKSENDYEILRFANSVNVRQLDEVYVIGNPWGLMLSISKGVVSSDIRRDPNGAMGFFIQTDAHVFQGNSGGPMLNRDGEVIGVNSAMIANEGGSYGLAIHANIVKKVLKDWKSGKSATWASIGIRIANNGTIKELTKNGPAMRAGLQEEDDIIGIKVGKQLIEVEGGSALTLVMATTSSSDRVSLIVKRKNSTLSIPVKPDYKPIS